MRLFSYKDRPIHLGPIPTERLKRHDGPVDLHNIKPRPQLIFAKPDSPDSLNNAMKIIAAYCDANREGQASDQRPEIPNSLDERANMAKSMCYFMDALHVGVTSFSEDMLLPEPYTNSDLEGVREDINNLPDGSPGFHYHIAHDMAAAMDANGSPISNHSHAVAIIL